MRQGTILLIIGFLLFRGGSLALANSWEQFKSRHFIIYYQKAPLDFVKEVEKSANIYYEDIARDMGWTRTQGWSWEGRARIYIYNDSEHYVQDARAVGWSAGHAYSKDKVIRTFPSAHGFFDTTLPHELGHIIFREFIGEEVSVPLWFEEGVAMYQEKARRWGSHRAVQQAITRGEFIPLAELDRMRLGRETPEAVVALYYAQAASVVHFLIKEQGQIRFKRLCSELKAGKNFMDALGSVYGRYKNLNDLNRSWVEFLKNE